MQKYIKIYLDFFNYTYQNEVICEVCGVVAQDIHHIDNKGMGGSKTKDYIENLIGVCRYCHIKAHDNIYSKEMLHNIHIKFMKKN